MCVQVTDFRDIGTGTAWDDTDFEPGAHAFYHKYSVRHALAVGGGPILLAP